MVQLQQRKGGESRNGGELEREESVSTIGLIYRAEPGYALANVVTAQLQAHKWARQSPMCCLSFKWRCNSLVQGHNCVYKQFILTEVCPNRTMKGNVATAFVVVVATVVSDTSCDILKETL